MRLSYTDSPQLLIADEYWLWVYDADLGSKTAIDVKDTPLWLLLRPKNKGGSSIDGFSVVMAQKLDDLYHVRFQDTNNPDGGF